MYNLNFHNKIAHLTLNHFNALPKCGKPNALEWTILSSITKYNSLDNQFELVALGTGTKCIGASQLSPAGDILNDSHAEIICRRAFLRYLYEQIENTLANEPTTTIFRLNRNNRLTLSDTISFHFFTTHMPCGDAAIFAKKNSEDFGQCIVSREEKQAGFKRRLSDVDDGIDDAVCNKRIKSEPDLHRTGAKCLENDKEQDAKTSGFEYHRLGAIRTKPGRGEPTLSVSCSDKLAKWSLIGIQGALLSLLLENPIYLASITLAGGTPYSDQSLHRALKDRFDFNPMILKPYEPRSPVIGQSDCPFDSCKTDAKRPCPTSIIWSRTSIKSLEVAVNGKKQGITKKNRNKRESRLSICKNQLFHTFINIITKHQKLLNMPDFGHLTYSECKNKAIVYQQCWELSKKCIFQIWTKKCQDLLNFSIQT